MSPSSYWILLIIGVALASAAAIARFPFYRDCLEDLEGRFGHIDGLRGYLALCVFSTHLFSTYNWHLSGEWRYPESILYKLVSSAPVSLFFMITAFLFWGKAVRSCNQVSWRSVLRSRLFRLAPLYLACLPVLFLFVGLETGWRLQVSPNAIILSIARWLGLGVFGAVSINGFEKTYALHPAIWTLRYEWLFYLSLPILGFAFRFVPALILACSSAAAALYLGKPVIINFALGAVAYYVVQDPRSKILRSATVTIVLLIPLFGLAYFNLFEYGLWHSLLLFPLFLGVCRGNSLFGALSNRPALVLGTISYSIYLVHMLAIHAVFFCMGSSLADVSFAIIVPGISILLIGICAITYRCFEYPFLRFGSVPLVALADASR